MFPKSLWTPDFVTSTEINGGESRVTMIDLFLIIRGESRATMIGFFLIIREESRVIMIDFQTTIKQQGVGNLETPKN